MRQRTYLLTLTRAKTYTENPIITMMMMMMKTTMMMMMMMMISFLFTSKTLLIKIPDFYILRDISIDNLTQLMKAAHKTKLNSTRSNWLCHLNPTSHS